MFISSLSWCPIRVHLVWLKRENPDEPWTIWRTVVDGDLKVCTHFHHFSEFASARQLPIIHCPVEITGINVAQERGTIVLTWKTSSELENYGFGK